MVERSRRSVGATLAAARAALAEGVAANLAGGTHHASAARGSGYCVFNDVAVASRVLQAEGTGARCRGSSSSTSTSTRATAPRRSSPATRASSRSRCTARRTSRSARRRATSTSPCPTAAATPTTCARSTRALDGARRGARDAAVRPGLLPRRRRPARGRPARPAQAQRRRPARARPARPRGGSRERRIPVALAMAGGYGHDLDVTVAIQAATIEAAIDAWRAGAMARTRRRRLAATTIALPPTIATTRRRPVRPQRRAPRRARAIAASSPLATRWIDNDAYGHLNNVVYLSLFDTAVNGRADRRRRARHRSTAR